MLRRATGSARSTASVSGTAGRTLSSANPVRASRPPCTDPGAGCAFETGIDRSPLGTDVATLGTAERRSLCAATSGGAKSPVASLDPRLPVFHDRLPGHCRPMGSAEQMREVASFARYRRTAPRRRQSLSRRVLRRSRSAASASRGHWRSNPRSWRSADGVGARCLHSGRDHQPAARPPERFRVVIFIC